MTDRAARVRDRLGYQFTEPALVGHALNHRSARGQSNERLEFLGDAVLDAVISHRLYARYPEADEGVLSRLRAALVRKATLAELGRSLEIGDLVTLGPGELGSGGSHRDSIIADALEALLGAVFLDGGYDAAEQVIDAVFGARLTALDLASAEKDAKTRLQEWLQARGLALPQYTLLASRGPDHAREFMVRCQLESPAVDAEASGSSRRVAEQRAAAAVLALIDSERT